MGSITVHSGQSPRAESRVEKGEKSGEWVWKSKQKILETKILYLLIFICLYVIFKHMYVLLFLHTYSISMPTEFLLPDLLLSEQKKFKYLRSLSSDPVEAT